MDKILSKLARFLPCLESLFSCLPFFIQFCRREREATE
nr:MAG TPA: hypothetical protein [Caudoviricetes sp.]